MSKVLFVKNNDKVDIKYYLYFDPNIPLITFADTDKDIVKSRFDLFNEYLKSNADDIKVSKDENDSEKAEKINKSLPKEKNDSIKQFVNYEQIVWNEDCLHFIHLKVKTPNHAHITNLLSASTIIENDRMKIDINKYYDLRLRTLLTDWNLTDEEENKVNVSDAAIDSLNHKVFESMITFLNNSIPTYL